MSKKIVFLLAAALLLFAAFASAGDLVVSSVNQDPSPATPGSYLNLSVNLTNNSNGESKNAVFNLNLKRPGSESEFPFSLAPGEAALKNLGTISARQGAVVKYRILVDPEALDGNFTIYLETGEDSKVLRSTPYNIRILGTQPTLSIISATPTEAAIGNTAAITLSLKNTGSSTAYDLSIGLSEERTVTTTGTVVERDIVPLGSSMVALQEISPGTVEAVELPILINPSAQARAYFIPVKITYYDSQKVKYTDTQYVGLKVFDEAKIGANATPAEALYPGKKAKISLELYNAGNGTAKFLNVKVSSGFANFKQSGYYIGSLESDDYDSISLDAEVRKDVQPGDYSLEVELSFKDAFSQDKSVRLEVSVKVLTEAEALQQSQQQAPVLLYAIIVLAITGAAWWFLKKKKHSGK